MSERCPWCGAGLQPDNYYLCGTLNCFGLYEHNRTMQCKQREAVRRDYGRRNAKAARLRRLRKMLIKALYVVYEQDRTITMLKRKATP